MDETMVYRPPIEQKGPLVTPIELLNLVLFGGQLAVTILAYEGYFFDDSIEDLLEKNETRISPVAEAGFIWLLVYLFQLAFTLRFLFKARRRFDVEVLFACTCLLYSAWVILYTTRNPEITLGLVCALWVCLAVMWYCLYVKRRSWLEQCSHPVLDYLSIYAMTSLYFGMVTAEFIEHIAIVSDGRLQYGYVIALLSILGGVTIVINSIGGDTFFAISIELILAAIISGAHDAGDTEVKEVAALTFVAVAGCAIGRLLTTITLYIVRGRNKLERSFSANAPEFLAFAQDP